GCSSLPDCSAPGHDPGDDSAPRAVPRRHPLARWRRLTLPLPKSAAAGRLERTLENGHPRLAVTTVTQHRRLLAEGFPIALGEDHSRPLLPNGGKPYFDQGSRVHFFAGWGEVEVHADKLGRLVWFDRGP